MCAQVLGRELLLHLADELVQGYRSGESWSVQLLNSTRIHVLPTMNPDGFDEARTHCQYSQGRYTHTHALFFTNVGWRCQKILKMCENSEKHY